MATPPTFWTLNNTTLTEWGRGYTLTDLFRFTGSDVDGVTAKIPPDTDRREKGEEFVPVGMWLWDSRNDTYLQCIEAELHVFSVPQKTRYWMNVPEKLVPPYIKRNKLAIENRLRCAKYDKMHAVEAWELEIG